jgi:dihydroorotase
MKSILITGANIVNEGRITPGDVLSQGGRVFKVG